MEEGPGLCSMGNIFYEAIINGDESEVEELILEAGFSVNQPFADRMFPINVALTHGQEDVAKMLIQHGASVNKEDSFGLDECRRQPIHYAAGSDCYDIVQLLLEMGVPIDAVDFGDSTPLHHAAANGCYEITEYLIKSGCDINHCSKSGRSALWKAAQNKHRDVVALLHKYGAKVGIQNKVGATVLFDMAKMNEVNIMRDLIGYGVDIESRDIVFNTALHGAASVGTVQAVQLLIDAGIDIDAQNENGNTALFNASLYNKIETMVCILNAGADWTIDNQAGQSPFYAGMIHTHIATVKLLLAVGADITRRDVQRYRMFETSRYPEKEAFLRWVLGYRHRVMPLSWLCRIEIREYLWPDIALDVPKLPLPPFIIKFLLMSDFSDLI